MGEREREKRGGGLSRSAAEVLFSKAYRTLCLFYGNSWKTGMQVTQHQPCSQCKDLLPDGGLKLAELGSWSASVPLGSDVAIASPLSGVQAGEEFNCKQNGAMMREDAGLER